MFVTFCEEIGVYWLIEGRTCRDLAAHPLSSSGPGGYPDRMVPLFLFSYYFCSITGDWVVFKRSIDIMFVTWTARRNWGLLKGGFLFKKFVFWSMVSVRSKRSFGWSVCVSALKLVWVLGFCDHFRRAYHPNMWLRKWCCERWVVRWVTMGLNCDPV